jgi:hypothetical protein
MKMRTAKKRKRTTKRIKSRKDEIMTAQETKEDERLKIKNRPCQPKGDNKEKDSSKERAKARKIKKGYEIRRRQKNNTLMMSSLQSTSRRPPTTTGNREGFTFCT